VRACPHFVSSAVAFSLNNIAGPGPRLAAQVRCCS
jgi:hypothetical protein